MNSFNLKPPAAYVVEVGRNTMKMKGRVKEILISCGVLTVPMVFLSGLLLGLIYEHHTTHGSPASSSLDSGDLVDEPDVIYATISATTLATVASWASTLAPALVGFAVTLISLPVARRLYEASQVQDTTQAAAQLPTPYQLSLLLRMIVNAGPGSFWQWLNYSFGWRGRRGKQVLALKMATSVLCVGLFLSTLVLVTDTWLHFTTKTINFTQVSTVDTPVNASFQLRPQCFTSTDFSGNPSNNGGSSSYALNPAASITFLQYGASTIEVMNNVSTTARINTFETDAGTFLYLGNPPNTLVSVDYTANTYAVQSSCELVSDECMNEDNFFGAGTPFNCPFAFQGDLAKETWAAAYFTDQSGQNNNTLNGTSNPYYFALAGALIPNVQQGSVPGTLTSTHLATVFVAFCNATVYDVTCSSINGSLTQFSMSQSNATVSNIIQGAQQYTEVGNGQLSLSANLAVVVDQGNEFASTIANSYSQVALGAASGAWINSPAAAAQTRQTILVARVPKAPLACLIFANLSLVVLGIILTVYSFLGSNDQAREVQARLTIEGLVADRFDWAQSKHPSSTIEELYEEKVNGNASKVGPVTTPEGGYSFGIWQAKPAF